MLTRVLALLAFLLFGGFLYYLSQRPGGVSLPLPGSKPGGITEITSKVPQETGFLLVMDARQSIDLKKDLQTLRDKFKDSPQVLKAIEEAESEMGLKFEELADWARPAGFVGLLPAAGQTHLWSSPSAGALAPSQGSKLPCGSNLKNMATALEMYSTDNAGRYPLEKQMLTQGNYLKVIPTCPSATDSSYQYESGAGPDRFTLTCSGHHEPGPAPYYTSEQGLIGVDSENSASAPPESETPRVVFGAPVGDEKLAQTHLEKLLIKGNMKPETVQGSKFWVGEDAYVGLHGGYLLGASTKDALEALLASFDGKAPNLTAHPVCAEMRKKVPEEQGAVAFLPLEGVAESLNALPKQSWDERTQENLQALRFLAGSASFSSSNLHANLVLACSPNDKADLVKALLTSPSRAMTSAEVIPADWNYYSAVDVRYLYHVILEGLRLATETRSQVDGALQQMQAGTGVDIEKDLFGAFTGEVAWSGNFMQKLPSIFSGNFTRARQQGQLTACKSNLKNLATATEMWASDNQGRYPTKLAETSPNYMKTIPTCPAAGRDTYSQAFVSAANPDNFTIVCAGHNHGSANDFPQYNAMVGLIEGDAREATPAPDPGTPTTVVVLAVKEATKAQELLKKLDLLVPFKPTSQVGNAQIFLASAGPSPVARALVSKPVPCLFLAYGPDSEALLKECLETQNPVSQQAEFKKVRGDSPQHWVSQSFLDLKGLLGSMTGMLESLPDAEDKNLGKSLLASLGEARGVSYTVVEKDGLRLVSEGNAAIATGGTAVVAAILVPNFIKARSQGQLTACKSNQKNLATAMEMYATDNAGQYPPGFNHLVNGQYLRRIPTCPAAARDTYSETYRVQVKPDRFSFHCSGEHHRSAGLPAGYPQYHAEQGLIDRP
jgi:hypothetical protein